MILRLLVAAALTLLPVAAWGHGADHAAHGQPTATLAAQGYRVELVTTPSPLALRRPGRIEARLLRDATGAPVGGGRVVIAVAPHGGDYVTTPAEESTWAGRYAIAFTPPKLGEIHVRVVVSEADGRALTPPLVAEFPAIVERPPGISPGLWTLIVAVGLLGVAIVYLTGAAARSATTPGRFDLLTIPWLRRVVTSRMFAPSLQVPLLAVMVIIFVLGLRDVQNGGVNVATKLTWTIWWAAIIFTFVLAGRVWCVACPFGALNEWASSLAKPLRRLPRPMRNIWWATAAFVLLTWADEQLGVVRSPRVTAWIIAFFAVAAIGVGLAYERRSFCRYLCPIGGLIGVYSMLAPLELRARDAATCRHHDAKECYRGTAAARGCPMFEFPQAMDRNNYCNLCGECVRGCSRGNLVLRFRALGADLWRSHRRMLDESYLAVALVGLTTIVTAEMLTVWPTLITALARWLPAVVRTNFKPVTYLAAVESIVLLGGTLVATPLVVLGAAALGQRLAGPAAIGVRKTFVTFGYMFVPIGLGLHLAHNLSHLLLEGAGIVPALQRAVALYTPWSIGTPDWTPAPLVPESVVGFLQMAIVVAAFVVSLVAGDRIARTAFATPHSASRALLPMAGLSFVFSVIAIIVLSQPMGMRHGM